MLSGSPYCESPLTVLDSSGEPEIFKMWRTMVSISVKSAYSVYLHQKTETNTYA